MPRISNLTAGLLHGMMLGETGLALAMAEAIVRDGEELEPLSGEQILLQNVGVEIAEQRPGRYPQVLVYCDRLLNTQREKFRGYSGKARLVVETRVSQDRIEGLERTLQRYTDAVLAVLHVHRGDWGQGVCYSGAYEATFAPVKKGGRNYIQSSKVQLEVDLSLE